LFDTAASDGNQQGDTNFHGRLTMYIDTHAHFDICIEEGVATEQTLIDELAASDIGRAVQISIDEDGFAWSRDFARRRRGRGVLFTAGIHPSSQSDDAKLGRLSAFLDDSLAGDGADLLLGVGETGLDFYRMRQPRDAQERSFEFQLGAAKRRGLPVIVHIRDAMDEGIAIMTRFAPLTGIMHCFSGDSAAARRVIDLGLLVSFAGNLTYPKATQLHDAARYVPLDRLLLETDAPFLTPVPYRGKPNRPAFVTHTYAFFATMRKEPLANVIDTIEQNFDTLIAGRRG